MHHMHGQTLKLLDAFAGTTWDGCLYAFEEWFRSDIYFSFSDNQLLLTKPQRVELL
jgi:hypothetical protein